MRWPWVGRGRLELLGQLQNETAASRDRAERRLDDAHHRIDELTGELIRMRREGFVPQPESPTPEATTPLPPAVMDAIDQRAFDAHSRRQLRSVAEQMVRIDRDEKDIVKAILEGEQFDEEEYA